MESIVYKFSEYLLKIKKEDSPSSPREQENLGSLYCLSNDPRIGDSHQYSTSEDLIDLANQNPVAFLVSRESTKPFNLKIQGFMGRWSVDAIGIIYADRDVVLDYFGDISEDSIETTRRILTSEINIYNQYLQNSIYKYELYSLDEDGYQGDLIDSSRGFYGKNPRTNKMFESLPRQVALALTNKQYTKTKES